MVKSVKQIKIPKKKLIADDGVHINLDPLYDLHPDYLIVYGGRYNGKSYDCKRWHIQEYLKTGHQFAYVRRWDKDTTQALVRQYFADSDIEKITGGDYNMIDAGKGLVEISNYDLDEEKKHDRNYCGFYFPINMASRYASTQYPNLYNIFVEEFIPINGAYAPGEMELLMHLFSTLIREREGCVTLIANSISRQSPYWEEFECTELVRKQEIGDIHIIERETKAGTQKIVIHYSRPNPKGNKLFAGKRQTMTVEGKWLSDPHPHMDDVSTWHSIYTFYVERLSARFKCRYMVRGSEYTVFVEDFKDEYPKNARVISDQFSFSPYRTVGFKPINDNEAAVFSLLPTKCCYDDDLVGTEFEEIIENFNISY